MNSGDLVMIKTFQWRRNNMPCGDSNGPRMHLHPGDSWVEYNLTEMMSYLAICVKLLNI